MVQNTCCGDGKECIVTDVSSLADPCMASCDVFYRLPDGSIWLLNEEGDGYQEVFVANDLTKIDWNADPDTDAGISNRPFKAIAWGLKLDDDGNLTVDKLILPTPDWNVTDPDNKDFIKNKPFQTIGDNLQVTNGQLNAIVPESITHSELQQILSEDINSIAYANSADGTDGFTTVYPALNLLSNSLFNAPIKTAPDSNSAFYGLQSNVVGSEYVPSTSSRDLSISSLYVAGLELPIGVYTSSITISNDSETVATVDLLLAQGTADTNISPVVNGNSVPWWFTAFGNPGVTINIPAKSNERYTFTFTAKSTNNTGSGHDHFIIFRETTAVPVTRYSKPKLESGSIATPYMPSSSEVQPSDYPKYIGFSNVVKPNKSASDYTWFPIPAEQIQSDWDVTDTNSKAFIKNKPTIPAQVQSDWNQTSKTAKDFIKNKPTIPAEQIQSDWNQTSKTAKDFIKNKPTIPAEQIQSDWNQTNSSSKAFIKNKPTIPAEQIQSDWNQTSKTAKDFIKNKPTIPAEQIQSDWNQTNSSSKAFIKNKPTIPEGAVLYPATGQNTNGAMTQKAVTDELNKKVNITDLSKYVTLDTNQTITGDKLFDGKTIARTNPNASDGLQYAYGLAPKLDDGTVPQTNSLFWTNPKLLEKYNGYSLGLGSGANLILGGGESHRTLLKNIVDPTTLPPVLSGVSATKEHAILVADMDVYIGSNYQNGSTTPNAGYWWKFSSTGKAFSPSGAEILDKTYGDKLYVSLTEVNHVLGETTFDNVKASSDTNGWVTITDRRNGFSGGTIQYKRHMNVVTIQGDGIIPPVMAKYEHKVICVLPDGARITKGKPTGSGMVSNVAMGYHCESNGELSLHAGDDLTTTMRASFTFTYVV